MGFYESNYPTNSVKALKEDVQGLGFNPTRSTPPCYNNTTHMQYDKITPKNTNINTKESMHSEMGPVRQNPIQRTVRTAHLSVPMCFICHKAQHFQQFYSNSSIACFRIVLSDKPSKHQSQEHNCINGRTMYIVSCVRT